MIGRGDLNYKFKKLYHGTKDTGFSVVKDTETENMWRVRWPDGILSEDYYNLTWAKDHAARLYAEDQNKAGSEPVGALK